MDPASVEVRPEKEPSNPLKCLMQVSNDLGDSTQMPSGMG